MPTDFSAGPRRAQPERELAGAAHEAGELHLARRCELRERGGGEEHPEDAPSLRARHQHAEGVEDDQGRV